MRKEKDGNRGRLACIESLIRESPGSRLLDIGSDHASLPIRLMEEGLYSQVLVTDLRPGPLKVARDRAAWAGLGPAFQTVMTDGLQGLDLKRDDLLLISGMGGETIAGILKRSPDLARRPERRIFQPQTQEDLLRRTLADLELPISRELCVKEGDQVYLLILSHGDEGQDGSLSDLQAWFGPRILEKLEKDQAESKRGEEALAAYLAKRLRRLEKKAPFEPEAQALLQAFHELYGSFVIPLSFE